MGAGVSSEEISGSSSDHRGNSGKRRQKKYDQFERACMRVFSNADVDGSGSLDLAEFKKLINSSQLNLKLSESEIETLLEATNTSNDGVILYQDFIQIAEQMLKKIYQKKETDWNDWCYIPDASGKDSFYLNKRNCQIQKTKPDGFNPERVEEYSFVVKTLTDGTEITTYTGADGVTMYMDWDQEAWSPLPREWIDSQAAIAEADDLLQDYAGFTYNSVTGQYEAPQSRLPAQQTNDEQREETEHSEYEAVDPRQGEYYHPQRGMLATYLFENTRNTRLYFDEPSGQWARMPLAWERNIADVMALLAEIESALPTWQNVNEQLMALRECNYILDDAIVFGEINWGLRSAQTDETVPTKLRRQSTRTRTAGLGRIDSRSALETMIEEELGTLSVTAASRINQLEMNNARLQRENAEMRIELDEQEGSKVRSLARENTMMADSLLHQESTSAATTEQIEWLQRKIKAQQTQIENQYRAAAADEANKLRIQELEELLAEVSNARGKKNVVIDKMKKQLAAYRDEVSTLRGELGRSQARVQVLQDAGSKIGGGLGGGYLTDATKRAVSLMRNEINALRSQRLETMAMLHEQLTAMEKTVVECKQASRKACEKAVAEVEEITTKYRAEVLQRKMLYNTVQELRGNIRVFLRCRNDRTVPCVMNFPSSTEVLLPSLQGDPVLLDFDKVYSQSATQDSVFADVQPTIMSTVDGYNVCIMAYGQTGSGKTYTMMGPDSNPGVNRRAIKELLNLIKTQKELEVSMEVSMLEVYNENVFCLLTPGRPKIQIRQGADGVYCEGAQFRPVENQADIDRVMLDGDGARTTAATSMNTTSSRSHLIFEIFVTAYNTISKVTSRGRLTLVDLAGSERVAKSNVEGLQLVEAAAINKSLSTLGQVFQAVSQNSPHVPYRNSKLTHVLQESIGGNSKTCLFINVRPDDANLSETHSTLLFGKNIRNITLGPTKKRSQVGNGPKQKIGRVSRPPPPPPPGMRPQSRHQLPPPASGRALFLTSISRQ